jgi:triacylglycerol lipase
MATAIAALAMVGTPAASAQSPEYPSLGIDSPGANDFSCVPPPGHPRPVVLAHGTFLDMTSDWGLLSPLLAREGFCVFALDYGNRATGPIAESARQLRRFVRRVREATGAERVAIVGHSQGGMMPRHYIKFLRGKRKVAELVGLNPSNHGTTIPLAPLVGDSGGCPACTEQVDGSEFMTRLNAGDETPGRIAYTQITTRYDEIVTPFDSAFLHPDDERVTNVLVQDRCPADVFEHILFAYDPVALQWVLNALTRPGPADPAFQPDCTGLGLLGRR